jgi:hypothetical protein
MVPVWPFITFESRGRSFHDPFGFGACGSGMSFGVLSNSLNMIVDGKFQAFDPPPIRRASIKSPKLKPLTDDQPPARKICIAHTCAKGWIKQHYSFKPYNDYF